MNQAGYIAATALAGALLGLIVGAIFGFFSNEIGWWGAGMLLGLTLGSIAGVSVAERMA